MQSVPQATLLCDAKCRARWPSTTTPRPGRSTWSRRASDPLGRRSLRFVETPMVHWPESMFTYVPEERLLFSMDAFGQHYASARAIRRRVPADGAVDEAKKYYANIVIPYGEAVGSLPREARPIGDRDDRPQPRRRSGGGTWRRISTPIAIGSGAGQAKVLVIYDTMWESTAQMAEAILGARPSRAWRPACCTLRRDGLTRIAAEVLDAAAVAVGCPRSIAA